MPRNERKDYSYSEVEDTSIINEEYLMPSTIETIDYAVYDWLNEDLNIFATTNKGWKKIPIVWSSPERAVFRKDKEARDKDGVLILPVISPDLIELDIALSNALSIEPVAPPGFFTPSKRLTTKRSHLYSVILPHSSFIFILSSWLI